MARDEWIEARAGDAARYDEAAESHNWRGPEVLFGLSHEHLRPGQRLLDIGIGTGLTSVPFHRAGLRVCGIDGSPEMLEACRAKGIAEELELADLRRPPLPHPDAAFDVIVSGGVYNFFRELDGHFAEAARLLRVGGIFAFTLQNRLSLPPPERSRAADDEIIEHFVEEENISVFCHGQGYVHGLLKRNGLSALKRVTFLASAGPDPDRDVYFDAHVARKG